MCAAECGGIIKVIFCISLKTVIERSAKQTKVCDAKLQGLENGSQLHEMMCTVCLTVFFYDVILVDFDQVTGTS